MLQVAADTTDSEKIKELKETFKHLMKKAEEIEDCKSTLHGAQNLSTILGKKDKEGYTVLTLAAKLGCREMFELVMETPV